GFFYKNLFHPACGAAADYAGLLLIDNKFCVDDRRSANTLPCYRSYRYVGQPELRVGKHNVMVVTDHERSTRTRSIPQTGHVPGLPCTTLGCIGHAYVSVPVAW